MEDLLNKLAALQRLKHISHVIIENNKQRRSLIYPP